MQLPISVQSRFFLRAASSPSLEVLIWGCWLAGKAIYPELMQSSQKKAEGRRLFFFSASVEVSQKLRKHFFIDFQEIKIPYKL